MNSEDYTFIWSDGWWIEDNRAWFVCGTSNTLFNMDLKTGKCEETASIPEQCECKFRQNPFCLKSGRDIFCIPGVGQSIWIYNLDNCLFTRMDIDKPKGLQLASQFWIVEDAIFIVTANWNKIIEVSISEKKIKKYYTVCGKGIVRKSILAGNHIYMTSSDDSSVYQFSLETKETRRYNLPGMKKELSTICFDGRRFWLSGYRNEIYIWDKENDTIVTIDHFPAEFETNSVNDFSRPVFKYSIMVGGHIWFIPIRSDKILYADIKNPVLSVFEIGNEKETEESILLCQLWAIAKYLLEYVRDDRYIGLFSAKSARILEIDTQELNYCWKDCYLKDKYFFQYGGVYKKMYSEGIDDTLYEIAYRRGQCGIDEINNLSLNKTGRIIYKKTAE